MLKKRNFKCFRTISCKTKSSPKALRIPLSYEKAYFWSFLPTVSLFRRAYEETNVICPLALDLVHTCLCYLSGVRRYSLCAHTAPV